MKLTRVVHTGVTLHYGDAATILPDVQVITDENGVPADRVLLFSDQLEGDAHAFMFTPEQIRAIGGTLVAPSIEIATMDDLRRNGGEPG